ncbi:hypothetical protein, partial [Anaplasma bovis]|uniref:hypothetical protein n=1 Tax=Anaplasma bovis TaxID=186733 RepID=UPI002FEEB38D
TTHQETTCSFSTGQESRQIDTVSMHFCIVVTMATIGSRTDMIYLPTSCEQKPNLVVGCSLVYNASGDYVFVFHRSRVASG